MKFKSASAQLYIPDGLSRAKALARTTHMGIGAHQDDLEIMAIDGVLKCFQQDDRWFTGVVVTDGRGSARTGLYANYTDDQMQQVRLKEQIKAAVVGEYAAQVLLGYPSRAVKEAANLDPVDDLFLLLQAAKPKVVYTHNLADKHDTHVVVTLKVIEAIRRMPETDRPQHVYGCEVWRDLDWLPDTDKIAFDCSRQEGLQMSLVGVFDSQITGGKRYDLATMGRRRAHATYHASHATDVTTGTVFAMNLTPLAHNAALDIQEYVLQFINNFAQDVRNRFARVG